MNYDTPSRDIDRKKGYDKKLIRV